MHGYYTVTFGGQSKGDGQASTIRREPLLLEGVIVVAGSGFGEVTLTGNINHPREQPLETWKEICAYLNRDVSTVIRCEKSEGLPVHRQMRQARGSVFAYPSELEAWKVSRELHLTEAPAISLWRRAVSVAALALTMLLALVTMANGPILNPTIASAQGIANHRVWTDLDFSNFGPPSPNGRLFPCIDWDTGGNVAVCDIVAGGKRRLTNGSPDTFYYAHDRAHFSPDLKQIAYAWSKGYSSQELRVVDVDGSQSRLVYGDRGLKFLIPLGWSPDGKSILALLNSKQTHLSRLVWVAVSDGTLHEVKAFDTWYPQWVSISPDGKFVAYGLAVEKNSSDYDIYTVASSGGSAIPLVEHSAMDYPLAWTPDGRSVLFASDRSGRWDAWVIRVENGRPQGAPVLVKKDIGRVTGLGFGQNGSFYYILDASETNLYQAALDPVNGKTLKPPSLVNEHFVGSNRDGDWSPDGHYLAYLSVRGPANAGAASASLRIRNLQDGKERALIPMLHNPWGPHWFPDGRAVAVSGYDLDDHQGIYRISLRDGAVSAIVKGQDEETLYPGVMSPDGRIMFFCRQNRSTNVQVILARNLATSLETEIYRSISADVAHVWNVSLSPDGRQLAFTVTKEEGGTKIFVIASQGGVPREICAIDKPDTVARDTVSWLPGSRELIFARSGAYQVPPDYKCQLWKVSISGCSPQKLDVTVDSMTGFRLHPDGSRAVFNAGASKEEVWVMENLLPALQAVKYLPPQAPALR